RPRAWQPDSCSNQAARRRGPAAERPTQERVTKVVSYPLSAFCFPLFSGGSWGCRGGGLSFFAMPDRGPKVVPIERATKFSIMTLLTVSRVQRAIGEFV